LLDKFAPLNSTGKARGAKLKRKCDKVIERLAQPGKRKRCYKHQNRTFKQCFHQLQKYNEINTQNLLNVFKISKSLQFVYTAAFTGLLNKCLRSNKVVYEIKEKLGQLIMYTLRSCLQKFY